jgi:hypothetical protein
VFKLTALRRDFTTTLSASSAEINLTAHWCAADDPAAPSNTVLGVAAGFFVTRLTLSPRLWRNTDNLYGLSWLIFMKSPRFPWIQSP